MKRSRSHPGWWVTGCVLIAFWISVMGLMFWPGRDAVAAIELSFSGTELVTPEEEWLGAYSAGKKLGYVHSTFRRDGRHGYLRQESRLWFQVAAGVLQPVHSDLALRLGEKGDLDSFDFNLDAGALHVTSRGQVRAQGLAVEFTALGESFQKTLPLTAKPVFDVALPRLLARQDLRPGSRFQIKLFDPQTLSNQPTVIEVVGRDAITVEGRLMAAIHLRRTQPSRTQPSLIPDAAEQEIWIDEDGRLLQETISLGLTFRRENEATATTGIAADGVPLPHLLPPTAPPSIVKGTE
jgi:hypothetical protein